MCRNFVLFIFGLHVIMLGWKRARFLVSSTRPTWFCAPGKHSAHLRWKQEQTSEQAMRYGWMTNGETGGPARLRGRHRARATACATPPGRVCVIRRQPLDRRSRCFVCLFVCFKTQHLGFPIVGCSSMSCFERARPGCTGISPCACPRKTRHGKVENGTTVGAGARFLPQRNPAPPLPSCGPGISKSE